MHMTYIDPAPYRGHTIQISVDAPLPLHALALGDITIQFPDAVSLMRYARANYDALKANA